MALGRQNYKRILLKISGEGFCKEGGFGVEAEEVSFLANEVTSCLHVGKELAIVLGAGNFIRGQVASEKAGIGRATADYMGMLATMINGLSLQDVLENSGFETRLMTALAANEVAEPYIRRRAIRHLEKGRILILVGGTGNPFFTTDTQAALRASEISADALLKATKVDGVYDKDPKKFPDAQRFTSLTYEEALQRKLEVMDRTAFSMCAENKIPIIVFKLKVPGNLLRVASGEEIGTIIR
jgi:uridylate kinase